MKIFSNLRGSLPLRALLSGLLVAALILGLGSATRAQAAHVDDAFSNVKLTNAAGENEVSTWERVRLTADWKVPDGSKPGDTFGFTWQSQNLIAPTGNTFDLPDANGEPVATCVTEAQAVTCTLNDYVLEHPNNVGGTMFFEASQEGTGPGTTYTVTVDLGSTTSELTFTTRPGNPYGGGNLHKSGDLSLDGTKINWYINLPQTAGGLAADINDLVVRDAVGPNQKIVSASLQVADRLSSDGGWPAYRTADPSTYSVELGDTTATVRAPKLEAGKYYYVHIETSVDKADPGDVLTNYQANVSWQGQPEKTLSGKVNYFSAGGTGGGDIPPKVAVGDYVWLDDNRDGIQDANEKGIPGVTLTLERSDGQPVTTNRGAAVPPATTDAQGGYTFQNLAVLPDGVFYVVKVDNNQAALKAYQPTVAGAGDNRGRDSSTSQATAVALPNNGDFDYTLDFGFVTPPKVSVGDYVWADTNRDGVQDEGEPGIPNVTLTIERTDGAPVKSVTGETVTSTVTDANGKYGFNDLEVLPKDVFYVVKLDNTQDAVKDYVPTKTGAGTTATDSSTGEATAVALPNDGDSDLTLDFGFVTPAAVSVGDYVWVDSNRNGVQDEGEPGIPGATLTIKRTDGQPVTTVQGTVPLATTTDANGKYSFDNLAVLPDGVFYVVSIDNTQEVLKPYVPTTAEQGGDRAADSSTGEAAAVALPNDGDSDLTLDFGFVKPKVSVGDFVWVDTNGNGVQDEGEPGIPGVTLTIERSDGKPVKDVFGETVTETKTGDDGKYSFKDLEALPEGVSYVVKVDNSQDVLKPYVPTQTGQGDAANDSSNGEAKSGSLTTDGDEDLTLDFGFVKPEEPSTPAPTPPASSPESTPASTPEETTATPTVPTSQSPDKPRGLPNTGA